MSQSKVTNEVFEEDPTLKKQFKSTFGVSCVCFNKNLKQVISGSFDSSISVFHFGAKRTYKLLGHTKTVTALDSHPIHNLVVSGSLDNTVRVWINNAEGRHSVVKAHKMPVNDVKFSSDGVNFVTSSSDKTLKVFNTERKKLIATLYGHSNWVKSGIFSQDGMRVISGSDDKTIRIWDLHSGKEAGIFEGVGAPNSIAINPIGTNVAAGCHDGKIRIFDLNSRKMVQYQDAHSEAVTALAMHPCGNYITSASLDGSLKVWDIYSGHIMYTLQGHEGPTTSVGFSPLGDFMVSGGNDKNIMVWRSPMDDQRGEHLEGLNMQSPQPGQAPNMNLSTNIANQDMSFDQSKLGSSLLMQTGEFRSGDKASTLGRDPVLISSMAKTEGFENDMKVMDQVMVTLDQVVGQLDNMNKTMNNIEGRITKLEDKKFNNSAN